MDTTLPSPIPTPLAQHYAEGSWKSPGYRSARTRAKWAKGFFIATAVASGFEALLAFQGFALMGDALKGQVTTGQYESFVQTADGADSLFLLCAVGLAVAFLAWLSRTVEITPALGAGTPHNSPRWAIGWWFVPIAFLWKPYTVVREVWDRLATPTHAADGKLVIAWWLAWIGSAIVGRFATSAAQNVTTVEAARGMFSVMFVAEGVSMAAAILGLLVVREIQARADERALALGFDANPPMLPSTQTLPVSPTLVAAGLPARSDVAAAPPDPIAFCPRCGAQHPDGARYCASCGNDLSPVTASSSPLEPG